MTQATYNPKLVKLLLQRKKGPLIRLPRNDAAFLRKLLAGNRRS